MKNVNGTIQREAFRGSHALVDWPPLDLFMYMHLRLGIRL